jgi:EpsI family protein
MMKSAWRALLLTGVFIVAGVLTYGRRHFEQVPAGKALDQLPLNLGEWSGKQYPIGEDVLAVLGKGDFISRSYRSSAVPAPIDLLVAYFPSQRSGDSIHSPKNCLPGAGWSFKSSSETEIPTRSGNSIHAGQYVLEQGSQRVLALYWYQAHGRTVASEYAAKYYLVKDAIRLNRTDGALVRVITPLLPNESTAAALNREVSFIENLNPLLDQYIPR